MTRPGDATNPGGQAYWDAFARARRPDDAAAEAALALHGFCPVYDAYRSRAEQHAVKALLPKMESAWSALDVGCGPGRWTVPLAQRCARVVALDYSSEMLAHARQACQKAGVASKVNFQTGTLQDLNAAALGGPFDVVLAFGVVQYLSPDELPDAARRLSEVLKPGGYFLHREILAPNPFTRESKSPDGASTLVSYHKSFEQYRAAFESAGLALLDKRSVLPPSLALSILGRLFPFALNARNGLGRTLLRIAIAAREGFFDPLCRAFPNLLWSLNSRRPTDQAVMLYQKRAGGAAA